VFVPATVRPNRIFQFSSFLRYPNLKRLHKHLKPFTKAYNKTKSKTHRPLPITRYPLSTLTSFHSFPSFYSLGHPGTHLDIVPSSPPNYARVFLRIEFAGGIGGGKGFDRNTTTLEPHYIVGSVVARSMTGWGNCGRVRKNIHLQVGSISYSFSDSSMPISPAHVFDLCVMGGRGGGERELVRSRVCAASN